MHREWAREGQPHFTLGPMSDFCQKQSRAELYQDQQKIKGKVDKVRERNYIECGDIWSLSHMFHIPKGTGDIRMVYNGTLSGLNEVV